MSFLPLCFASPFLLAVEMFETVETVETVKTVETFETFETFETVETFETFETFDACHSCRICPRLHIFLPLPSPMYNEEDQVKGPIAKLNVQCFFLPACACVYIYTPLVCKNVPTIEIPFAIESRHRFDSLGLVLVGCIPSSHR